MYGIGWAALLAGAVIYSLALHKVWRNRRELYGIFNPFNEDPFSGTVTTEIAITRTERPAPQTETFDFDNHQPDAIEKQNSRQDELDPYSVNIESANTGRQPSIRPEPFTGVRTWTRNAALQETNPEAWLYARAAFLYYCVLFITWVWIAHLLVYLSFDPEDSRLTPVILRHAYAATS